MKSIFIKNMRNYIIASVIIILLISLDQITKSWLIDLLRLEPSHKLAIGKFLNIVYVWNYGISFGIFSQFHHVANTIFICLNISITLCLLYFLFITKHKLEATSLIFIISGAIGNLCDRFVRGAVFDFIDIHYKSYHFAVFNVADIYISLGAFLLLVSFYFNSKNTSSRNLSS